MTAHDAVIKLKEDGFWKAAWRSGVVIFMLASIGWVWASAQLIQKAEAHIGDGSIHHSYRDMQGDFVTRPELESKMNSFEERMSERFRSIDFQLNQIYERQNEIHREIRDQ